MTDEKGLAVFYVGGGYRVDVDADAVDVEEKIGGEAEREAEGYVRDNLDYIEENTGLKIRDLGFWDYHFSWEGQDHRPPSTSNSQHKEH